MVYHPVCITLIADCVVIRLAYLPHGSKTVNIADSLWENTQTTGMTLLCLSRIQDDNILTGHIVQGKSGGVVLRAKCLPLNE